ncbi:MAG: hypothetical protein LBP87_13410, partial [Planctomycetaceae bacterium]|nr:hypothetical protein [Planctomycetaceae bacterium]
MAKLFRAFDGFNLFCIFFGIGLIVIAQVFTVSSTDEKDIAGLELLKKPNVNDVDKHFDAYGYYYTGGGYQNDLIPFRLHVPVRKSFKKYPLFVFFHGRGNFG